MHTHCERSNNNPTFANCNYGVSRFVLMKVFFFNFSYILSNEVTKFGTIFGEDYYNVFIQRKNIKSKHLIAFLINDCSQLLFEVYYVCVAQKMKILENSNKFFLAWTLATLATSSGLNFNLRVSNFSWRCKLSYEILFVVRLKWKLGVFRLMKQETTQLKFCLLATCTLGQFLLQNHWCCNILWSANKLIFFTDFFHIVPVCKKTSMIASKHLET